MTAKIFGKITIVIVNNFHRSGFFFFNYVYRAREVRRRHCNKFSDPKFFPVYSGDNPVAAREHVPGRRRSS